MVSTVVGSPRLGNAKKINCKIAICYSGDRLNFGFSKEGLGLSSPHVAYDFSRKIC